MKKPIPKIAPILSLSKFKNIRIRGKKIVLVGGAFDVLHIGHIKHLENAKSEGDILVVQITGDKRYFEKRGYYPMIKQGDRAKIVAAIRFVDYVFISNKPHFYQNIIEAIDPDVLFFNKESFQVVAEDYVKNKLNFPGKIVVDKLKKINSSSEIKKRIEGITK